MYSLATARTTRSATQHAASSAGSPVVPAMNPSSARKKRRAGSPADEKAGPGATPSKKARATPKKKTTVKAAADPGGVGGSDGDEGGLGADSKPRTTPKKFAAYLTTPYPDYARPTAEECEEVTRLLGDMHGLPQRPGRVEKLKEDGPVRVGEACGAVPSVCDALIRTILSQNTTNNNSARAYASLLERFGPSKANTRAVSLPAVFRADLADVQDSIRCGGLANVKGKVITGVLKTVYDRNLKLEAAETSLPEQAVAIPAEPLPLAVKEETKSSGVKAESDLDTSSIPALASSSPSVKRASRRAKQEILSPEMKPKVETKADSPAPEMTTITEDDATLDRLLSLDYVHQMADDEAMRELESFPGVGPKTASCVLLFCLERDSFAVDTHVYRLSKALGWVPARATRETTYEHLDVRIPSALKYPLHVLLIAHGKACTRCAANGKTSRPSLGPCPLVGLTPIKSRKVKADPELEVEKVAAEEKVVEDDAEEVGESLPLAAKAVFDADVDAAIQQAHGGR